MSVADSLGASDQAAGESKAGSLDSPHLDIKDDKRQELQQLLAPALESLSPMERTAFVLRHYEGVCIEEIGKALGVHSGAAKHSVFRAVQKLRKALEPAVSAAKS